MLEGPIRFAVIIGITALAVAGLNRLLHRAKPVAGGLREGTIRPDRITATVTVVMGLLMVAGGAGGLVAGWGLQAGALMALGVATAGFMAPSLTNVHAVSWNDSGIKGPSTTFGLTLGFAHGVLGWDDLVRTGKTVSGYWYVEASDGQRVYWSYLYRGHGSLAAAILQHRPNLTLPDDL